MMQYVYDKQFIPSKFGFNNNPINLSTLQAKITQNLKQFKLDPIVKDYCNELLLQSVKGSHKFNINPSGLPDKDINIILKDFGELTGAAYLLKTSNKYSHVKFPTGNEKLIDYILVTKDGLEEKFSAKAGQGGKPSITSVMPIIKEYADSGKLKGKHKLAAEVLSLIATDQKNGLYLGPLLAAQHLNTPGYRSLIGTLKKLNVHSGNLSDIPTSEQLQEAITKTETYEKCIQTFTLFFKESGYSTNLNQTVTKRLFETPRIGKEKQWGILHYPITAELIKWLNTDFNEAKDLLTMAANTLTVTQVYLDKRGTELTYTVKGFSDATFLFGSPSSMPRPTNNRIGFTMKKNPKPKNK